MADLTWQRTPLQKLVRSINTRASLGLLLFVYLSFVPALHVALHLRRPMYAVAWLALTGAAVLMRRRPLGMGLCVIAASVALRVGFIEGPPADQIIVSQAAWERVLHGGNPYGIGYAETIPPGAPFPYGPLGLVWWLPGPAVEFVAAMTTMLVLFRLRAWLTLAVVAGWHPELTLTFSGVNDYSPGLLILVAMLAIRNRRMLGAGLLAAAVALKPYAAAWVLPAIGYGGIGIGVGVAAVSAFLWSPLLVWGPGSFLRSVELARAIHVQPRDALNLPVLQWVALPIALAGLLVRRWEVAALLGSATFVVFLFTDRWASYGYWLAVIPVSGVAIESLLRSRFAQSPRVIALAPQAEVDPDPHAGASHD